MPLEKVKEDYTHIAFAIDRSGSMAHIVESMCEGFDEFINGQKEVEGRATVTLARFDNEYEIIHDMIPLEDVDNLDLQPRGMTALLDGMGRTMNTVKEQIMAMEEDDRPSKCVFIFITDGCENASTEFNREQIFQIIEDSNNDEDVNYEFVFLGANQDAIAAGGRLGIRAGASMDYSADNIGTQSMYGALSRSVTEYRTTVTSDASMEFTDEDRESAKTEEPKKLQPEGGDPIIGELPDIIDNHTR